MAAPTSTSVDQFQWDSLPWDLKDLVLAHLSQAQLLRLRSVCRSWLATLTSSHFHRLHCRLHPRSHPSLLIYNHAVKISTCNWRAGDAAASVTDMCPPADPSWHAVNALGSAADTCPAKRRPSWHDLSLPGVFVREWVGAHTLVCIRNHLTSNAFSVGCPFSNQWNTLPNPPRAPLLSKLWAMVTYTSKRAANAFSVILLQLKSPSVYLDVYNSESNQWTQRALPVQQSIAKGAGNGPLVSFSSMAVCIGRLVYSVQAESRSVVTYDVQRDVWRTLEAKLPANLVFQVPKQGGLIQTVPQIMEGCKGKVLMMGAASYAPGRSCEGGDGGDTSLATSTTLNASGRSCEGGDDTSLTAATVVGTSSDIVNYAVVWELDWSRKEWREMARAPTHMCMHMVEEALESRKAALTPVKYSGHAELIIVMASGSQRALQFDGIEEKWDWLDLPAAVNCDLTLCLQPTSSTTQHF